MAVANIKSNTLDGVVAFINDPLNDVDHVWVFKHDIYLGSFLPKVFGKIKYDLECINILLYINKNNTFGEEIIRITKDEFSEYSFNYL